jgi:(R,R)-butanediol dehydrogenase/meso-butanediol dehydrogenase/diacetyl reductase
MRAVVFRGKGDIRVEEVPVPDPGEGEVLLEVHAAGICGTDAGEYRDGAHWYQVSNGRHIPGHEFAGQVVATGSGVPAGLEGRLVACGAVTACGRCAPCLHGKPGACLRLSVTGAQRPGGLAEYCAVPASTCRPLGGLGISTDIAALAQPAAVAVHAWSRAQAVAGDQLLIVGAGAVGFLISLASGETEATVTVADIDADRAARAARLGGARALDLSGEGPPPDGSFDAVLECSGTEPGLRCALRAVRPGGRVVIVGHQHAPVRVDLRQLTRLEIDLIGTNALDPGTDLDTALLMLAAKIDVPWPHLIPEVLPLERMAADGFAALAEGRAAGVKVLADPRIHAARGLRA